MSDDYQEGRCGSVFMAFVVGAAIGGGLALLTAPRSGEETRGRLSDLSDDVKRRVQEIADDAEKRIKETIDEGRETYEERKGMLRSAVEAGREAMQAERAKHEKPSS